MKSKTLVIVTVALLLSPFLFPTSGSAFWPFSSRRGEVMGEQTEGSAEKSVAPKTNSQGILSKFFKSETPVTTAVAKTEEAEEDELTEAKINMAMKNRTITAVQRLEILSRLKAIKAEREKLKSMRESFTSWLKLNNLERSKLIEQKIEQKEDKPTKTQQARPRPKAE